MIASSAGIVTIDSALRLPLTRIRSLEGDAGFGRSAPSVVRVGDRLAVSRRGLVSCHDVSMRHELWHHRTRDWASVYFADDALWIWDRPTAFSLDEDSGEVLLSLACPTPVLRAGRDWLFALDEQARESVVLTSDGVERWRGPSSRSAVSTARYLCLTQDLERRVVCLSRESWTELWTWTVPQRSTLPHEMRRIAAGFPGVAIVGDRVLVTTLDMSVTELDAATGETRRTTQIAPGGAFLVTDSAMVFWNGRHLTTFDHRTWEQSSVEMPDLQRLYGTQPVGANAFAMSTEALIWTTMQGSLFGVSLNDTAARTTWRDDVPGALMPIAAPPVLAGRFMYHTVKGDDPRLDVYEAVAEK